MARLRAAALAVSLALVGAAVAVLVYQHNTGWMYDARVYRTGGAAALHGLDLYANVPPAFTYTPFAALLFVPLTFLPVNGVGFLLTAISLLCLEGAVWLSLRLSPPPHPRKSAPHLPTPENPHPTSAISRGPRDRDFPGTPGPRFRGDPGSPPHEIRTQPPRFRGDPGSGASLRVWSRGRAIPG